MDEKREDYLIGLALFTLARRCYDAALEAETALSKHLGYPETYMGHISDALHDSNGDFDRALDMETKAQAAKEEE